MSALLWIGVLVVAVPLAAGWLLDSLKSRRAGRIRRGRSPRSGPRHGPMGTGQRVALFVGLLLFLAGIGVGVRPLGHVVGTLGTLYCTEDAGPEFGPAPIGSSGQGSNCPSHTYQLVPRLSAIHVVERNCGSAFLPAAYDSGATRPGPGTIPAGITQSWDVLPPCDRSISTWRYQAGALLLAGVIVALAGFFIFRTRKPSTTIPVSAV